MNLPKFDLKNPTHVVSLFAVLFLLVSIPLTIILSLQSDQAAKSRTAQAAATRDPYKHPFASNSPWNMPIGSGAQYGPETLGQPSCYETSCRFFLEEEYIFMDRNAPLRTITTGAGGGCSGGTPVDQVRIPDGVTFGGSGGDNDTGGALKADNVTVREWYNGCRTSGTGSLVTYHSMCEMSLYSSGIGPYCGHGGSMLSAVGGSLRVWELAAGTPIRHTLKLTLSATLLNNDPDSPQCNDGYRWPAGIADNGWNTQGGNSEYSGTVKSRCMGSLLALPKSNTCSTGLELTRRICAALRDYGAYIVDIHPLDSDCYDCWRPFALNGEPGTESALNDNEMIGLISQLQTITNNSSTSIGGGGTPLVPLTEDICPTLPCGTGGDQPPSVSITSPSNGSLVNGTVTITASASDDIGVNKVEFYVDGTLKSTDTSSPYSYGWDTTGLSGSHTIFAKAFDTTNQTGQSSTVTVNIGVATLLWCEAESATLIAPMVRGTDSAASGGSYLYTTAPEAITPPPTGSGTGSLTFNVPNSGTYTFWARVYYGDGTSNSHYVRFNSSTSYIVLGNDNVFGSYRWINFRDGDTSSLINTSLIAGSNTVHIHGREPNSRIDKILLTTDSSFIPSGTGGAANCSGGTAKTGDTNADGKVDTLDLSYLLSKWGTTDSKADINKDGTVNILDLSALLANWG